MIALVKIELSVLLICFKLKCLCYLQSEEEEEATITAAKDAETSILFSSGTERNIIVFI